MLINIILLSAGLLFIALLGMSVGILFRKDHKFPEHRVGHNKAMRKKKIYCAKTQDAVERKNYFKKIKMAQNSMNELYISNPENQPKPDFSRLKPNFKQ